MNKTLKQAADLLVNDLHTIIKMNIDIGNDVGATLAASRMDARLKLAGELDRMADVEPVSWHCCNSVTGRMKYTQDSGEMLEMQECKTGHWVVTALYAAP